MTQTLQKYTCRIEYTEHSDRVSNQLVFAHSQEDADYIARVQFLEARVDKPTIKTVIVTAYFKGQKP